MSARAPLDVDLEDKLLYGLTPTRLAYVVVGLLAAFALCSSHWAPGIIRGFVAACDLSIAAGAAWGRWRGRPSDSWAVDAVRFVATNHRLSWHPTVITLLGSRPADIRARSRRIVAAIASYT
jgi:hypothetical protein